MSAPAVLAPLLVGEILERTRVAGPPPAQGAPEAQPPRRHYPHQHESGVAAQHFDFGRVADRVDHVAATQPLDDA
ncbi:MAG TPA: hypothetical protein VGC20_02175, partial [bacterium]